MVATEWDDASKDDAVLPWHDDLQVERGSYVANLANMATALRAAPELVALLAYDEMQQHIVLNRNPPGARHGLKAPRPVVDADIAAIQEWVQRNGLKRMPRETVQQAVSLIANEHRFHPVRDYLDGLVWDGTERLRTWLHAYLGAADTLYHGEIGRLFLISMVARIYRPGCKADYMLILQGEQGLLKSAACRVLAGEWFSDNLPAIGGADHVRLSMHLRGKWLIEIGELSSFGKADTIRLKEFLSQTTERYVAKHARNEVSEPRQVVFVGTTNKEAYLRDETGDRRYWPAVVSKVALSALAAIRDQLFAEACVLFRAGEKWHPDRDFERKYIKPEQDAHTVTDAWEEHIEQYILTRSKVTLMMVATECLQMQVSRLGTADQHRIRNALTRLGWDRQRDDTGKEIKGTNGARFYVNMKRAHSSGLN